MWKTLVHYGPFYPTEYIPLQTTLFTYGSTPCKLSSPAELAAILYANIDPAVIDKVFETNFWSSIRPHMPTRVKSFAKCDFSKLKGIEPNFVRKLVPASHRTCIIDGNISHISSIVMEQTHLFKGRGTHPKRGSVKFQVPPERVILNLSETAKIPICIPQHSWGKIVHKNTVSWIVSFRDDLGVARYIYPDTNQTATANDHDKFELARKLKRRLTKIRNFVHDLIQSTTPKQYQLGCAICLIDRFCIRVGNEKDHNEADTVGACTLRCEHLHLLANNRVRVRFLGKDSVEYDRTCTVPPALIASLKLCLTKKGLSQQLFDAVSSHNVNTALGRFLPGLTAKVFRTAHASRKFCKCVRAYNKCNGCTPLQHFRNCNKTIAQLCNHKRTTNCTMVDALSTSRVNYIDPRIAIAFFKRNEIKPSNRIYSHHAWAQATPATFVF